MTHGGGHAAAEGGHIRAEFGIPSGRHGKEPLWLDCSSLDHEAADGDRKGVPQKLPAGLIGIGNPTSVTVTGGIHGRGHVAPDGERGFRETRQTVSDRDGIPERLLPECGEHRRQKIGSDDDDGMTYVWIHTSGPDYWEGHAVRVPMDSVPRIGETVYLAEETLSRLLDLVGGTEGTRVDGTTLSFRDNLTVIDVCHVEGEASAHVMVDFPERQP